MSEGNITMDLTEVNEEVDEQPLVSAPEEEEPEEPEEQPVVEESEEVPEEVPEEPAVEEPEEVPEPEPEPEPEPLPEVSEPVVEEEPEPVVEEEPEPCLGDEIIVECGIHQGKTFTETLPLLYEHYGNVDDVKVWIGKAPINGNDKLNALKYLDIWMSENQ
tara:strand:- start:124 stop:606 length:483 start_codon:yes stop_codon:yes gene_type:complete